MDADLGSVPRELPESAVHGHINGTLAVDYSELPEACALCQRILSSDNEAGDLEAFSICGDCKFLFLEDVGTPTQYVARRRTPGVRRTRYNSSESIESMFSQQFSNIINLARHNQPAVSEHENQSLDGDSAARLVQRTSSHNTPSGSRRWRRVLSDTESDGFGSLYGESDVISFSAYGGDSDASVDAHSFLDNDMFTHPDGGSDLDSDTDIDPMHAGLSQWNSDDQEEDEEDEDEDEDEENNEWEDVDAEENTLDSLVARVHLRRSLSSNGSNFPANWRRQIYSPENEGTVRLRIGERRQPHIQNIFANSGDYLDARGFDELLERLAETDSLRSGAPPTALSFVNSLERVVINEEHEKHDGSACAICKDSLSVGTVVNQLPCFHLYHPSCILPWLRARNSCPLCRYELPTDDKDYENMRESSHHVLEGVNEDSTSEISEADEGEINHGQIESSGGENGRGRWFFLAAAPIVSLLGIALVLWLGNPLTERRGPFGNGEISVQGQHAIQAIRSSGSCPTNRRENRSRRWWSLF